MIVTLLLLGVISVAVLTLGSNPPPGGPHSPSTSSTTPGSVETPIGHSIAAACTADFATVNTAIGAYRSINGAPPPAGRAWATSRANGGPFLQSWPDMPPGYSLTWDGVRLSVVPPTGLVSHASAGRRSPVSGCYAP